jgi:hypothetical protein
MAARVPALVLEAFAEHPDVLSRVAAQMGCASRPRRLRILRRFRAHPIMDRGFMKRPVAEICALLRAWLGPGHANPIPRKLRDHLEAGAPLSAASVERHRQTIARRLVLARLDVLRAALVRDLALGLPSAVPAHEGGRHALMLLGSIGRNRRLLRRLLLAYGAEGRDVGTQHPANRAWLARHPRVDVQRWMQGVPCEREIAGHGRVSITVERDPLEALKLGTYVGSCLSIGGSFDFSAVAVVADVNKQVLYARRADGVVVGRQLVAIAEDDRLVFFPIYPPSAEGAIQQAFLELDRAFAQHLGLEPFVGDDYDVALIVARDWWDDGVWEPWRRAAGSSGDCVADDRDRAHPAPASAARRASDRDQ